ncbi:hypothetical protein JQN72_15755 [Phycicoccus sp. CSK15P-2]|uniref:pullulanase X25 domain-containing protein n=1 Tax=Phycicoccus sp. CSK15P-2 TaxID=2807627 RepID=UPI001950CDA8|nr:alpha-amylase family glycosyl hydrolase [Phycicoccus sp. CSK15P-2]MBM6405697.1 hypothetical protein [Phycicoccus sp. CSK15P-2]
MPRPARRLPAVLLGALLLGSPGALAALPASAATGSVALVGDLQDELGCAEDWMPACEETELAREGDGDRWSATFEMPAGSWEYKVALDDGWAESYGAGGVQGGPDIPLHLEGPARVEVAYDDATHAVTASPVDVQAGTSTGDRALAKDSLREPLTRERFYFVMAGRFANGSRANDRGGLTGGRLTTGFDPSDKAFYHGGDLAGLTDRLDYIKGLGTTAIWLTPSFTNKPVQGAPGQESAGYHGYWITDFTRIDPHLGTNAEMKALVAAAHRKGMKVFFDIITNHTADVIDDEEGRYSYRTKAQDPYRDVDGQPFDDRDYVDRPADEWPELDPATSFPYAPFLHPGEGDAKTPAWLNDVTMYHNRGDSTFAGESSTYGDFVGLDDLFTERPEVARGMGEIYRTWVDFGIDGFRIDTVKHVNLEFWQQFVPDVLGEAERIGNDDFFAFGEVYDGNPAVMSQYTTAGKLQATLDFGFQQRGVDFAEGGPASALADFYADDDWYTDADSNAYQLPTFLGNHDMGRVAMFLADASADEAEHLQRVKLADSLMFTTRGNPVTYYGDEQGFIGTGGDQLAREDLFASQVDVYNSEDVLAGPEGSRDRYDPDHPLYRHLRTLAEVRDRNPALADGAQVARYAEDGPGIFAVSRIDRRRQVEYVVAANSSSEPATATFDTWTSGRGRAFRPVFGADRAVRPSRDGTVRVAVPPLSVSVWKANKPITTRVAPPTVTLEAQDGAGVSGRAEVAADVVSDTFAQATFWVRPVGTQEWQLLGTDDNAPFRVFHDVSRLPLGTLLEYRVAVRDARGRVAADGGWAVTAPPGADTGDVPLGDPVPQPDAVSVPGTHNSEMGCPVELGVSGDWAPDCDQAQLALDDRDGIWKEHFSIPAGSYGYKAATNRSWTENYGAGGVREGDNISYETPDGDVTFYYDHATHWATSDEEGPVVTAPGSYQSELGCGDDWQPGCMRPWLQDPDGDGTYTWATTRIPAGTWELKVAHGLSWDESYGAGGSPDGGDITLTVPSDGARTTFVYDSSTHFLTVTSEAG